MEFVISFDMRAPDFGAPAKDLYAAALDQCAWADDIGFAFDREAPLTAPVPTIAILASNQLLRFVNHGVKGDTASLQLDGKSWLDDVSGQIRFRLAQALHGRDAQRGH